MPSKTYIWAGCLAALLVAGCATTPYTKRHQLMMVSESDEDKMGEQAYQEILQKAKISTDAEAVAMVRRVGERIAKAADKPNYKWQFTLIDEPKTVNAFCLPGGRVAFYTGILPITKDEKGLAVVMGHEIAHAIARHGAERISDQTAAGVALGVLLSGKSETTQYVVQQAYGIGVALPFNRRQESEADHIGLILMAKAGYDPREGIPFWQRMAEAKGGSAPPPFLSTHPSDKQRIEKIKELLPEALKYYNP
jgi:metalloendopeptidase OMA1, mitochondrial